MDRFSVSRSRANTLIRTETARIQTESAAQRYKDDGLEYYYIRGREEKDNCGNHGVDCRKMDGKKFLYSEMVVGKNAPPFHPNCRCRIVPVVSNDILRQRQEEVRKAEQAKREQRAEAERLKSEAQQLREQARALKAQGKKQEAQEVEKAARALEKQYKEIYSKLNN